MNQQKQRISVLIVDDHKIVREGLAGLLKLEHDIEVVGEAPDGPQAIELAQKLKPDVVIMDINMPGMNGIETTKILTSRIPGIKIIGLSVHFEIDIASAMKEAGAIAYVTKGGASEDLLSVIRSCHKQQ